MRAFDSSVGYASYINIILLNYLLAHMNREEEKDEEDEIR